MRRVAFVGLAPLLFGACELEPPVIGRACASDADCGDGSAFYCQLEVGPHVCVPLPSGVPPLPNHAPVVESALVVVAKGVPGEPPSPVSGVFRARDPDGDGVRFGAATLEGALGTLVLDQDGGYTFTPAEPMPDGDASEALAFEVRDDRDPAAVRQARALVYVVAQPPSAGLKLWRGESSAAFDDAGAWQPAGAPDAFATALVGPGAGGPLRLEDGASRELNGWLSSSSAEIALGSEANPATLLVRGTRVISGAALAYGTVRLAPAQGFGTEVLVAGELPSLVVETDVDLAAPVHARGDLTLALAKQALEVGSLVVDGALRQEGGAALSMTSPDAVLVVGGTLTLAGERSRLEDGLLVLAGDLDVTAEAATAGPDLRALFNGDGRASEEPQAVRLAAPERFRFLDVVVGRTAAVRFASSVFVDGALSVLGAFGVAERAVVEVDTLILRPSMEALGGPHGELRARRCFVGARVDQPAFVRCDATLSEPPAPEADAGVVVPVEPDAGPAEECPPRWLENANDLFEHSLVVVSADPPLPSSDALAVEAAAIDETTVVLRTGELTIGEGGAATFVPSGVAGHDEVSLSVLRDFGGGAVVATEACGDVYALDTAPMNVLVGALWDDPASWSFGRVPTSTDMVFVPPGEVPRIAAPGDAPLFAGDLWVASGALLDTGGRDVHVGRRLVVGGELRTGEGTANVGAGGELAGRIERLSCRDGIATLVGDLHVGALTSTTDAPVETPCGFDLKEHRLTVAGDAVLSAPLELRMQTRPATMVVQGRLEAPALLGVLEKGELQLRGQVDVASWDVVASENHQLWIMSTGPVSMPTIDYDGWLLVTASDTRTDDAGEVIGDTPLVIRAGGHVGLLTSYRTIDVVEGELNVDTLQWTPLFGTATPDNWRVGACASGTVDICP